MKSETLSGRGTLWNGALPVLKDVPYSITITTRDSGMHRIDGSIEADLLTLMAIVMMEPPAQLVLQLQDGRRWECYLTSSDGRLVNRGQLT